MTYELNDFCKDCRNAYDSNTGIANLERIQQNLERLLENKAFIQTYCGPEVENGVHTLYRDPDNGFLVMAHINRGGRISPPHDHGTSWAIYGQAVEYTEMTEYTRKDDGLKKGYGEVEPIKKYRLDPGMVGKFGPRQIHAINFPDGARFIRVTATDLGTIETLRFNIESKEVVTVHPDANGFGAGNAAV